MQDAFDIWFVERDVGRSPSGTFRQRVYIRDTRRAFSSPNSGPRACREMRCYRRASRQKGGALTLKTALPARNAVFIVRRRGRAPKNDRNNVTSKKRLTCQLCTAGLPKKWQPALGSASSAESLIPERDASPKAPARRSWRAASLALLYQTRNLRPRCATTVLFHWAWMVHFTIFSLDLSN